MEKVPYHRWRTHLSLGTVGDRAVVHGLRGRGQAEQRAVNELSKPECRDFGPTYAAEHLSKHFGITPQPTARKPKGVSSAASQPLKIGW